MIGNNCLLDTSIVIHSFRGNLPIRNRLNDFEHVFVSAVTIGELYYGAFSSSNPAKHLEQINSFLINCVTEFTSENAGKIYGRLKAGLKKRGTPMPENDIWIAAVAIDRQLPLFTTDKHFDKIEIELVSF